MKRNDFILLTLFVSTLLAIVLIAFAPVAQEATITMRVWSILASPISVAVFSTFIAAFAGTWGAQALAERSADRKALLAEMRTTNIALGLILTITNTYVVTKKRHIRDLVRDYKGQVARREQNPGATATLNLEPTYPPSTPISELKEIMCGRMTPDTKVMILLSPLEQSIIGFASTASERNAWIEEFRRMPDNQSTSEKKLLIFFGLPYALGRRDDRYPKYIEALEYQTDDCIAFSILLGQSLSAYGERLAKQYGEGAPIISTQGL